MNILSISYHLPPFLYAQSIVVGRLLYYLAKEPNFNLFVVTADEKSSMPKSELYKDFFTVFKGVLRVPFRYNRYMDKIKFTFLPLLYAVPDVYKPWNNKALEAIKNKWSNISFDSIMTFSSPQSTHLLGLQLKMFMKCKWFAFLSDPWADNPYYKFKFLLKKINEGLEKKVFFYADKLIFTSEETKDLYIKKYPEFKVKYFVMEHTFDPNMYCKKESLVRNNNHLKLRYIGNLSKIRTPEHFLKGIKLLLKENPSLKNIFKFEIVGGHRTTRQQISRYGLSQTVKLMPFVDYRKSLQYMQEADVLVVIDACLPNNVFLPSKLIEYIGAHRPILGVTPSGPSERIIRESNGWLADPKQAQQIKEVLLEIIEEWRRNNLDRHVGRAELLQRYDIKNKIEELKNILHEKE